MELHSEILTATPNLKLVRDNQGRTWFCDTEVSSGSDLRGQGCVREDEVIYDRSFGG